MAAAAIAAAAVTAGCGSQGSPAGRAAGAPAPAVDFGVPARIGDGPAAPPEEPSTTVTSTPNATAGSGSPPPAPSPSPSGSGSPAPTATAVAHGAAPPAFTRLAAADDGAGDAGIVAPPYADIRSLRVDDDGTLARFTVTFAGPLPARLPDTEVMGVGVDLYGETGAESEAEVFADGEPTGWFAYLQVGSDVGRYPGTLDVAGSSLVFTVPWSAVADLRHGGVRAFADWSRDGTPNVASSDQAPDGSPVRFSR